MQKEEKKPKVKMVGEDGNAFAIMARCHKAWRKANKLEPVWHEIRQKMMKGNYDHLLNTVMEYFEVD